jgi:outer membrane protein assembly factor BamB
VAPADQLEGVRRIPSPFGPKGWLYHRHTQIHSDEGAGWGKGPRPSSLQLIHRTDHIVKNVRSEREVHAVSSGDKLEESRVNSMTDWPMRDRTPNRHPFVEDALSLPLRLLWKRDVGSSVFSQAISVGGKVIVTSMRDWRCVDLDSGTELWSFAPREPRSKRSGPVLRGTPSANQQMAFMTDDIGGLFCLGMAEGELRWSRSNQGSQNEAVCSWQDQLLLKFARPSKGERESSASSWSNGYSAVTAEGDELWAFEADDIVFTQQAAVSGGILVFGDASGTVYGVQATNGELIWKMQTSELGPFKSLRNSAGAFGPVSTIENTAILGVGNKQYYGAFNVQTGKVRWVHHADALAMNMACDRETMYYVTHTGHLRGVSLDSGKTVLDQDISRHRLGTTFSMSALVVGGHLVAGFGDSLRLAVLNTRSGELEWVYEVGGILNASPIFVDRKIVIGCDDGYVYCFEEVE